jgi:hypothetical protein
MSVGVTCSLNTVTTALSTTRSRHAWRGGPIQRLAQRPGFDDTRESAEAGTLYGTPEEVSAKLRRYAMSRGIWFNSAGIASPRSQHEIMPALASELVTMAV